MQALLPMKEPDVRARCFGGGLACWPFCMAELPRIERKGAGGTAAIGEGRAKTTTIEERPVSVMRGLEGASKNVMLFDTRWES
jgi:hypothetical protein